MIDYNINTQNDCKNLLKLYKYCLFFLVLDKEGNLSMKKSSAVTKEEFKKLQQYVNKAIKEIATEILNGNIALKPYYKEKKVPCEYCSYKNICGFNSGVYKIGYRFINKKTKEEFFEEVSN